MGLAASQCRLLVLTARKSDLEYRAQNITNRKLLLSAQTENIAMEYTRKLNNRQMRFVFDFNSNEMDDINENLTINSIYTNNNAFVGQYRVKLADGRIAVSDISQLPFTVVQNQNGTYSAYSKTTPADVYASLSQAEKVQYLATMLTGLSASTTLDTTLSSIYGTNAEAMKEMLSTKVDAESGAVVQPRRTTFENTLNEIFANATADKTGLSRTATSGSTTTAAGFTTAQFEQLLTNAGTNADSYKESLKAMFKAISEILAKTGSDAAKVPTGSNVAELKAEVDKFTDSSHTLTNQDYADAIAKLNAYCYTDKDSSKDSWLNVNTSAAAVGTAIADSNIRTVLAYGAAYASQYTEGAKSNTSSVQSEDYTKGNAGLVSFLKNYASLAQNLIMGNSEFQARCNSGSATVVSEKVNNGDGTTSEQLTLTDSDGQKYIVLPALNNPAFFQNALRTGSLILEQFKKDNDNKSGAWTAVNIAASQIIQDKLYTEDDQAAEAEYETQTAIIQNQDKMLDVELRQVETQQKACDNEYESVKKILDKNIERSFKVFS